MEKNGKKAVEAGTEVLVISFQKAFEMIGDRETAMDIAGRLFLCYLQAPTRTSQGPSVDDIIAGLKESMEKEHGKEGKK